MMSRGASRVSQAVDALPAAECAAPDGRSDAQVLEEELLATASSRPRSLIDEMGWAGDGAADFASAHRDQAEITQLLVEVAAGRAAAAAPVVPTAASAEAEPLSAREQLVSTLRALLYDGQGEALLELGPLAPERADATFAALRALCTDELGAHAQLVLTRAAAKAAAVDDGDAGPRVRLDVLVRLPPSEQRHLELRVAVIGNVDAGKSTLVGVLVSGSLDNGRGSARLKVLRHRHECESGRTSSIAEDQYLGFSAHGEMLNAATAAAAGGKGGGAGGARDEAGEGAAPAAQAHGGKQSWCELVARSAKVVAFIDLAGHERYLKTTLFGMTAHDPDYAMVVVGANHGVCGMTKEHVGVAIALHVPLLIVVTKSDLAPAQVLRETHAQLQRLLRVPGARKRPFVVRTMEDVLVAARAFREGFVAPIFTVSNVSGCQLQLLQSFVNLLPARKRWAQAASGSVEFLIDQFFNVPGLGTVVAGTLVSGTICAGGTLLLGPDQAGAFKQVAVKSVHHMRAPVCTLLTGQAGAILIRALKRKEHVREMGLRKGMVLLAEPASAALPPPRATWRFACEVLVLHSATTMRLNYQPMLHVRNVRQSARIIRMDREVLRTGCKASIEFEFMYRPEWLRVGSRLLFREGKTKGIGNVSALLADAPTSAVERAVGAAAAPRLAAPLRA